MSDITSDDLWASGERGCERGVNFNRLSSISRVFANAKKKSGLNLNEISELTGISRPDLVDLECGMHLPLTELKLVQEIDKFIPVDKEKFARAVLIDFGK